MVSIRDKSEQSKVEVGTKGPHSVTFVPESNPGDDPRIIEQLKKGSMIEAIKIHRELNNSSLFEAKQAVEEMKGRLGI